jgi:hypothetical protein
VTPQRIYILPTISWTYLSGVLATMWYAAISQGNSAAYLLMFFLASLVLVSAVHAHFALTGLSVQIGRIEPVFAGEVAHALVELPTDTSSRNRPTRRCPKSLRARPPAPTSLTGPPGADG